MEAAIITTYRCANQCTRCHTWANPSDPAKELTPALLEKLPPLEFCNVTGGEPFLRDDLHEIVRVVARKARRVVVSTNGFFTDKVVRLAEAFPQVGIRVSLEGLPRVSDELRGMKDSFDHGLRTLLELTRLGRRDVGFSTTISDRNAADMLHLYRLARGMGWEFATAAVHNSTYFHKLDNRIEDPEAVIAKVESLIAELLSSWRVKDWFRAWFNHGITEYLRGRPRLLPCCAAVDVFFVDPSGEVLPCNGTDPSVWQESLGNLHEQEFAAIWGSERARRVRELVRTCPRNCWMIGTVSPRLRRSPWAAARWVAAAQLGRGLAARGHEVTAYVRSCYTPAGLHEHDGIRLIALPTIQSKHLDATLHSLLAAAHAACRPYDVVHFHGIGPGAFAVLPRMLGRRVVCTVHRLDWKAEKWGRLARRLLRLGELVSVRSAHRTIAVSAELRDHLLAAHGLTAALIPNGLDPVTHRPVDRIRKTYGLEGRDYLLFMGRLSPEKRVDWLIRSFLALAQPACDGRPVSLVIAGGFNATEAHVAELRRLAGDDPRIVFTGFVSGVEKQELLSNALAFVLPSRIEGMPIVLLEALSYGLCCVVSDIAAHREVLTEEGSGVLFDTARPDDLTARLQALLAAPKRIAETAAHARHRMAQRPGWDEVVERTEAVYRELVAE